MSTITMFDTLEQRSSDETSSATFNLYIRYLFAHLEIHYADSVLTIKMNLMNRSDYL